MIPVVHNTAHLIVCVMHKGLVWERTGKSFWSGKQPFLRVPLYSFVSASPHLLLQIHPLITCHIVPIFLLVFFSSFPSGLGVVVTPCLVLSDIIYYTSQVGMVFFPVSALTRSLGG